MKNIYIDANPTLLYKNSFRVSKYIDDIAENVNSIFISLESAYEDQAVSSKSIDLLLVNCRNKFRCMPSYSPKAIENYLILERPDNVIMCGYRVPDIVWLSVCNKLKINTINFQHGFDIDHVKRKISSMLKDYMKVIKYALGVVRLSFYLGVSPIRFCLDYINFVVFGADFKGTLFEDIRLWPNKYFVCSDYYIKFMNIKIGISKDRIEVMGATDLMKVYETRSRSYEHAVCYLAQTFVEDGRVSKSQFLQIIMQYRKLALSVEKFYIKLHPRSDVSIYAILSELDNVELIRDYFPYSSIYISHYSSTVFLAGHLSHNVVLHNLPDDPSPDIFKDVASFVSSDINQIIEYSEEHINENPPAKNYHNKILYKIAPIPKIHPLKTVANFIIES
jgi:hypothetical protein